MKEVGGGGARGWGEGGEAEGDVLWVWVVRIGGVGVYG